MEKTAETSLQTHPQKLRDIYAWQEKNLRVRHITNLKQYYERKKRFLTSANGQKFLRYRKKKFCVLHGLSIWIVDGDALRGGCESGDVDFTMGGHGYFYVYIPKNEIWIDDANASCDDLWPTIWHEYLERNLMKRGITYNTAHTLASQLEIALRTKNW